MKKLFLLLVTAFTFIGGTNAQCFATFTVSPNSGCGQAKFELINTDGHIIQPGSGYTADWNDGLGETLVFSKTFNFTDTTTVYVTVRYSSGNQLICMETLDRTFNFIPGPLLTLSGTPYTLCGGEEATFCLKDVNGSILPIGTAPGWGSWWSNGAENVPCITINTPSATVTVTDPSGCSQVLSLTLPTAPKPKVTIVASGDLCGGSMTLFADVESASGCPFATWSNGGIGLATSITSPGYYIVTVTDDNGCSATASINVTNNAQLPTVNFIYSVNGQNVFFQNLSSGGNFRIWDFGDGSTSSELNPNHTYTNSGTYTVTLTESNCCGMNQVKKTLTVQPIVIIPTAIFTATTLSGCGPLTSTFSSNSLNATSVSWTFEGGNPSSSNSSNPTVVFSTVGPHTVTLTATNANGSHSVSQIVAITGFKPTAGFLAIPNSMNYSFINQSVGGDNYLWTFGDGGSSYLPNPSHSYLSEGTYLVSLTVFNSCGSHTVQKEVKVNCMSLNVSASPEEVPLGYCLLLSAEALGVPGHDVQWHWSGPGFFPDGPFAFDVEVCPTESGWFRVEAHNLVTHCITYDSVWVKVWGGEPDPLTDDETLDNGKRISIIPNPATDFISATLPEGDYVIYLFDISGKEVRKISTQDYLEIDVQNLPAGQYFLHITEGDEVIRTENLTIL